MALASSVLGERIRRIREQQLALTQDELAMKLHARKAGKSPNPASISRWERGVTEPSLYYLRQIAALAGIEVSELVNENGTEAAA